ncbi:MAG: S41 family peptidase [Owenweeksia sp.]|nr:S41 family peptidase [Owenweeksia sp.]
MAASRKLAKDASAPDGYSYQPLISGHRASFGISREDSTVGILDIDGFSRQGYKKFYRNVFKIASDRKINHLVIDLRHNGGGYFPNGNRLLSYFMDSSFTMDFERPIGTIRESKYLSLPFFSQVTQWVFNLLPDQNKRDSLRNYAIPYRQIKRHHWKHNTYVLTDGGTFSMASYVATKLKAFCRATVIGTETGGGEEGSNAILMYKLILPHSQNRISIPLYHLNHGVNPELIGHGLIPKIITEGTPITVMEGIDLAMKEFYELIDSNR